MSLKIVYLAHALILKKWLGQVDETRPSLRTKAFSFVINFVVFNCIMFCIANAFSALLNNLHGINEKNR